MVVIFYSNWRSFLSEKDRQVARNTNSAQWTCGSGLVLLMFALACAITIGNLVLTSDSRIQSNIIIMGGVFLVLFAFFGGYLSSKGLILVLRDSHIENSDSQA